MRQWSTLLSAYGRDTIQVGHGDDRRAAHVGGYLLPQGMPARNLVVVYPIKACRGVPVPKASITPLGFLYDREWMLVSADKGRLIAQARAPNLALVEPSLPPAAFEGQTMPDDAAMYIDAPGMSTLKVALQRPKPNTGRKGHQQGERGSIVDVVVWGWCGQAIDEGPEASEWWTTYLGMPARLVRIPADMLDRQVECAPDGFVTGFTNYGQFLFASEASLEDLNRRLDQPVVMNRFRPNVVIRGSGEYEEDQWRTFATVHGAKKLHFSYVMRCARCKVPNIDQETAQGPGIEPGKTLATYRSGEKLGMSSGNLKQVYFGTFFVCDQTIYLKKIGGQEPPFEFVAVGDTLDVLSSAS